MSVYIKWTPREFLKNLDESLASKLDVSAELVSMKAKENCPVQTGKLRGSINHITDKEALTAKVGSNLEYAWFVEMGTKKMSPRAYLRKGLYGAIEAIKAIFSNKSGKTIERLGRQDIFK